MFKPSCRNHDEFYVSLYVLLECDLPREMKLKETIFEFWLAREVPKLAASDFVLKLLDGCIKRYQAPNLLPEYIFSTLKIALKIEQKMSKKLEKLPISCKRLEILQNPQNFSLRRYF